MSLSQQWYQSGSNTNLQTAEIGWQNQPLQWNSQSAVLFVYWTRDGYSNTGCYNLCSRGGGFVQTDNAVHLGASLAPVSTPGGTQYASFLGFYLYQGNWWGAYGTKWFGYYPGTIYKAGQMSRFATFFALGGETSTISTSSYPPMGGGQFANKGFGYAAYENNIFYRDSASGTYRPSLTLFQKSVSCYTGTTPAYSSSAGWATYFYFGGPGGSNC